MSSKTSGSSIGIVERSTGLWPLSTICSIVSSTTESMPSPRKSIFTMRASSTLSLSQWQR